MGGSEADTVAFLRRLGFENRYMLIERAGASSVHPGRLSAIRGRSAAALLPPAQSDPGLLYVRG